MTKIRTILNGFVNINLETDENKFAKLSKQQDDAILNSNIRSSNITLDSLGVVPPVSLNRIAEAIGLNGSSIQLAVVQGSKVYGVENKNSDWDITVISTELNGYRFVEFSIDGKEYDVHIYSPDEFQSRIDRKEMRELEILSYPQGAFLTKTLEFQTQRNRSQLIKMVRQESDTLWFRAKNYLSTQKDDYQALKTIWHSIRFLIFAEQILRFGKIEDLSAANSLRGLIVNSKRLDFEYFDTNFGPLREQMKLELGRHIGEDTTEKKQVQTEPGDKIERRYATANFQGFYIQKGNSLPSVEARYIRRNTTSYSEDNTWRMFIRFGDSIEQNWRTFNPPNTDKASPECKEGCVSGYIKDERDNFQRNNKMFFGQNPDTKEFGDFRLRIKNVGNYPANINGTRVNVNESIVINIDRFNYNIKLPANTGLLAAETFYEGSPLTVDTLTKCIYEFTFEIDYDGLNFKLRNFDNSVSENKEFNLGTHSFDRTYSFDEAGFSQNHYMLVSEYSNVWPFWESDFKNPETGPYCIAAGELSFPDPIYPTDASDLKNVLVDGIMFLHQTIENKNSKSILKTNHVGFRFAPNGQSAASEGCGSVNVQYPDGDFAPQLQTSSIPFKVI